MVLTLDMERNAGIMNVYNHPHEVLPSVHAKLVVIGFENAMCWSLVSINDVQIQRRARGVGGVAGGDCGDGGACRISIPTRSFGRSRARI